MIEIAGTSPRSRALRAALALTLALSAIVVAPLSAGAAEPYFKFNGGGWGHGIGLSQYGARGYALQGQSYSWILAHYYQGTRLETKPSVTVRVNLDANASARTSWRIQSGNGNTLTVRDADNTPDASTFSGSTSVWITVAGGNTRVNRDETYVEGGVTKHRPGSVVNYFTGQCSASTGSGGLVRILSTSGPFGHSSVNWRGYLRFVPSGDTTSKAVNYVDIESYLYGVVPRESPSSWPAEALKAQAVAARSYAYQDAKDGRTIYCSTMSQVYNGHSRPGESHEASFTNSAVDATKGKVVWYGSETQPVKTYFSSSTGGHTASIQDVWTESTPKEYYTGVTDADQDSPYYRWSVGPLTSTTVSSKVRTKDANGEAGLQYSAPYPHKIVGIALERADSGFTHHLTIRWSNGESFRIKGDTMRSALGLKSTKFSVSTTYPVPDITSYQESDSNIAWYGPWSTAASTRLSGGSMRYTATAGSKVTVAFQGTGIAWIGNKSPRYGKASVYLDGKYLSTYDLYSSSVLYQQKLFSKQDLSNGPHTLVIRVGSTRNAKSTGNNIAVDRFDVSNGTLTAAAKQVTGYEESSPIVAWPGEWTKGDAAVLSGGSQIYTSEDGAEVRLSFVGSEIRWIGSQSPKYGAALVTLDGASETVTLTAGSSLYQQTLWSRADLDQSKRHSLTIRALGPTSGGTDGYVAIDRLDVVGGWASAITPAAARLEETSTAMAYVGSWSRGSHSALSGGSHAFASTAATASLTFDGTSVRWIATKGPNYGLAEVWIDGSKAATVDLYSTTRAYQQAVFRKDGLPYRRHTIVIKPLGTKRTASTGTYVSLDAVVMNGTPVVP